MRQGTVGVWRSHAMRERRKRTGKEFNNELFLVMTMHEISHKRGLYKIPEEQKYKSKTKFRSWKCLIIVPSHCRKDKKVLMVPNFGKSHFVEIGRPVFSAVGKLWVVSLALGTRTQRRVARSSYTTGSTTPPPTHQKTFLRQIKCYFTPHPPPNKKKSPEWSSWVAPPVSPHNPPDHFCERFSNSDCSY